MHRRPRHLNPIHAGAVIALDSRFVFGLSDGAAMTSWPSRAGGTNYPQESGATSKPLYKVNQLNGQPGVWFDGSNDVFDESFTVAHPASFTFVGVARRASTGIHTTFTGTGGHHVFWWYTDNKIYVASGGAEQSFGSANTATGNAICCLTKNGTTEAKMWVNGSGEQTLASPNASSGNITVIGQSNSGFCNGNIGLVALFPSVLSDSLRKRFLRAASRSFKIQCS